MRLDELRGVPADVRALSSMSSDHQVWSHIDKMVTNNGYEIAGEGNNGNAYFYKKGDKVLKVFMHDAGYERWVEFAKANAGNPWVPVFRSNILTLNPNQTDHAKAIFIEELTHSPQATSFAVKFTATVYASLYNSRKPSYDEEKPGNPEIIELINTDADFKTVYDFLTSSTDSLDVNGPNIMMRGTQIVFADPLY